MDRNHPKWNLPRPFAAAGFSMIAATAFLMLAGLKACWILIPALISVCAFFCVIREYGLCKVFAVVTAAAVLSTLLFAYRELVVTQPSMALDGRRVTIEGTLTEAKSYNGDRRSFLLSDCVIDGEQTGLKILLYAKAGESAETGDTVTAENAAVRFAADKNEYYYHTLSDGCWLSASCITVQVTPSGKTTVGDLIRRLRIGVTDQLYYGLTEENGGIAAALLTGDRNELTDAFTRELRIAGASHLFAVSGFHLSLWASVLFFVMQKRRNALLPNLAVCGFILFYTALTGFSPSVLRAGIMSLLLYSGRILKQPSDPLNSVGLAACLLLTNNIYLAGNVSFLLSFVATAAIITLFPVFQAKETRALGGAGRRLVRWQNTLLLSFCVLLYTAPVSGLFFGNISLLAPFSSLICALPTAIVMVTAFLGVFFGWAPFISGVFYTACDFACDLIRLTVGFLSRFAFFAVPADPAFLAAWYFASGALTALVWVLTRKNTKKAAIALLCCVGLLICFQFVKNVATKDDVTVYIPSVGNATACCVSSDNYAFNVLIGTGEDYSDAAAIRSYLQKNAVFSLDALVIPRISNPENGNTYAFAGYPAKNIYTPPGNRALAAGEGTEADIYTLVFKNGLTYENLHTDRYSLGMLSNGGLRIVFCFYPASDLTQADPALFYGDWLFCRGGIPAGLPTENFKNVIVLSDKSGETLRLPKGAASTADTGDITIKTSVPKN